MFVCAMFVQALAVMKMVPKVRVEVKDHGQWITGEHILRPNKWINEFFMLLDIQWSSLGRVISERQYLKYAMVAQALEYADRVVCLDVRAKLEEQWEASDEGQDEGTQLSKRILETQFTPSSTLMQNVYKRKQLHF